MARENAARGGVKVSFQQGDVAAMPFAGDSFDFLVCRAAFKNFGDPVGALQEMYRVLRPGGRAVVLDMRNDASGKSIKDEVAKMQLSRIDAFLTRITLSALRKRAYSKPDFERMARATRFGRCDIREESLGFEVTLAK
jgi:ubiquinone/menaquinone biosynthesis C-methylase UbiE